MKHIMMKKEDIYKMNYIFRRLDLHLIIGNWISQYDVDRRIGLIKKLMPIGVAQFRKEKTHYTGK